LAKIEMTPEQKRELASKGFVAKPAIDIVSNRRFYWDPRKDEKGKVMGWTRPLPGDTARMNFYLRKGFKLEDPDGNIGPPPGYFRRNLTPMLAPTKVKTHEVGTGKGEIGQKSEGVTPGLQCPICQKEFPDADTLVHHMSYHRSAKAKSKARRPKRGKVMKSNKGG
jgi:hypothetical protein